jgi:hypothetical protein
MDLPHDAAQTVVVVESIGRSPRQPIPIADHLMIPFYWFPCAAVIAQDGVS